MEAQSNREGQGRAAALTNHGSHGKARRNPPVTLPLRGFGGTPDSKVEEGSAALRTDSNTASV